jgi:hypothetical protein
MGDPTCGLTAVPAKTIFKEEKVMPRNMDREFVEDLLEELDLNENQSERVRCSRQPEQAGSFASQFLAIVKPFAALSARTLMG